MSLYKARKLLESEGLYLVEASEQDLINARKQLAKQFADIIEKYYSTTGNYKGNSGRPEERLVVKLSGKCGSTQNPDGSKSILWDHYALYGDQNPGNTSSYVITGKLKGKNDVQFKSFQELEAAIKESLPEGYSRW